MEGDGQKATLGQMVRHLECHCQWEWTQALVIGSYGTSVCGQTRPQERAPVGIKKIHKTKLEAGIPKQE